MLIDFNTPGLALLRTQLLSVARRGVQHAGRNALNATAFEVREEWQRQIAEAMVLRNKWTQRSIRVTKARGTNLALMHAVVGSVADYMRIQEFGGTETKSGRHGVPIPTTVASGEGRGASVRRRLVRRPNRLPNVQLAPRPGKTRKQRNAAAIDQAIRSGRKHVFLELDRRKGLFLLAGGKRSRRVELIWDLSRPSVRIPATRTLGASMAKAPDIAAPLVRKALVEQLERALRPVRDYPSETS